MSWWYWNRQYHEVMKRYNIMMLYKKDNIMMIFSRNLRYHARHIDRRELIERTSPPPGGIFLLGDFQIKNPEEEDHTWRTTLKIDQFWGWFFKVGPLPPGSWFGNHPTKKPPPEGGVSFDQYTYAIARKPRYHARYIHMGWLRLVGSSKW